LSLSRRGRPGGRHVDSSPRRFAVACCQMVSPNGVPHCVLRRNAFTSVAADGEEMVVFLNGNSLTLLSFQQFPKPRRLFLAQAACQLLGRKPTDAVSR
jgi:hypothetical protein